MKKIYYTVYKTTNLLNNKYYIGVHKTININDSYIGSGKILKLAIKKYGIENFKKEIIYIFDNSKDAYNKEKEIVDDLFVKNENTYNLTLGGIPTTDFYPNRKYLIGENHPMWGKKHSDESNEKRRIAVTGRKHSKEAIKKISENNKGKISWCKGKKLSKSDIKNKSIAALKLEKIECPHCKKLSDPGNSKRWHFNNCKLKI